MIVTIAIDTDEDKDGIETLAALAALVDAVRGRKPREIKTCADLMETARRRSAGEQVIYKRELPKKRGRKTKNFNKE